MAPRTTTVTTHLAPIPIAKTVAPSIIPVITSLVPPSKARTVGAKHCSHYCSAHHNHTDSNSRPHGPEKIAARVSFIFPLHYIPASATKIAPRETIIVPTVQVTTISATTIIITVTTPKRHNPRPHPPATTITSTKTLAATILIPVTHKSHISYCTSNTQRQPSAHSPILLTYP